MNCTVKYLIKYKNFIKIDRKLVYISLLFFTNEAIIFMIVLKISKYFIVVVNNQKISDERSKVNIYGSVYNMFTIYGQPKICTCELHMNVLMSLLKNYKNF